MAKQPSKQLLCEHPPQAGLKMSEGANHFTKRVRALEWVERTARHVIALQQRAADRSRFLCMPIS
jgi:hypothetical protein